MLELYELIQDLSEFKILFFYYYYSIIIIILYYFSRFTPAGAVLKVKETIQKYEINFAQTFKICYLGHYKLKITKLEKVFEKKHSDSFIFSQNCAIYPYF